MPGKTGTIARFVRYPQSEANIRPDMTEVHCANTQTRIACRARHCRGRRRNFHADGVGAGEFQPECRHPAATDALRSGARATPGLHLGAGLLELERRPIRLDRRRLAPRPPRLRLLSAALGA